MKTNPFESELERLARTLNLVTLPVAVVGSDPEVNAILVLTDRLPQHRPVLPLNDKKSVPNCPQAFVRIPLLGRSATSYNRHGTSWLLAQPTSRDPYFSRAGSPRAV